MKYKLSETYPNEFLTLHNGQIFYKKGNTFGQEESVLEVNQNDIETKDYIRFGTIVPAESTQSKKEPIETRAKDEITKEKGEEKMKIDKTFQESTKEPTGQPKPFRETKTLSNDKVIEEAKKETIVDDTKKEE